MSRILVTVSAVAVVGMLGAGNAQADQSGLAEMHAMHIVKGRKCFNGHTHVGTGSPSRSKREAIASAEQDWSSFTAFEYGSSWANWKAATAKVVKCEPSHGKWSCEVQGMACLINSQPRHRQAHRR